MNNAVWLARPETRAQRLIAYFYSGNKVLGGRGGIVYVGENAYAEITSWSISEN